MELNTGLSFKKLAGQILRVKRPKLLMPTMDPSNQTTNRCRLLELPGELRNMIYEHALTFPRGLVTTPENETMPGFVPYSGTGRGAKGKDPNPLRYTCRQLHYESQNLLLKYNTCVFTGERQAINKTHRLDKDITAVTGLDHFLNFIYGCGTPGPKGPRKAIIQHEGLVCGRDVDNIFQILADDSLLSTFCRQHPKVQVIIRFRVMCTNLFNPGKHLEFTNLFSLLLRQRHTKFLRFAVKLSCTLK
jgi:hypothetical protein